MAPLCVCSHLQRNPDNQLYPMFEYFENWCQVRPAGTNSSRLASPCGAAGQAAAPHAAARRTHPTRSQCAHLTCSLSRPSVAPQDENRHGDFLTAVLKARPELLNGLEARLWSRFFCLSVYITMYLNDHARHYFYEVRLTALLVV